MKNISRNQTESSPPLKSAAQAQSGHTSTFLFSDIEGSTLLLQDQGTTAYQEILAEVRGALRRALVANGGAEVDTAGDGFFGSFSSPGSAVLAAVAVQREVQSREWKARRPVSVRVGIHTGESVQTADGLVGLDVHRAARICSAAHGGQILVSLAACSIADNGLSEGITFLRLGEVVLKGVKRPEQVFQVVADGLRTTFPPLEAERSKRTNLPDQVSQLVGRENDVNEIRTLLLLSETSLLTLTGPGGTGKTSLALKVGSQALEDFPGGVFFVSLVDLTDPELVPVTICQSLGLANKGTHILQSLTEYLGTRNILLILDNFEQVTGAAEFVSRLLASCPRTTILVTSRTLLRIRDEREYRVLPLTLPERVDLASVDLLDQFSATSLFVQRAALVHPGFEPTDDDARAIAEICQRVDGLPLAIELAAARIKLFSPASLLDRLRQRFDFLRSSQTGTHERHQAIKNTIDWSYDLLTVGEKRLLQCLSVFRGGWPLEAAEAICGIDTIEILTALIDKSLVRRESVAGEIRFSMLEMIHEYATQRLVDSGNSAPCHRKHADYFLELAERSEEHLTGPDQRKWLEFLGQEHDNFREVFRWVAENKEGEIGLRLGAALWRFWVVRGFMIEGESRLRVLLALPGSAGSTSHRARALNGLGTIIHELSSFTSAKPPLEESLEIWRVLDDRKGIATTLNSLGWIAMFEADHERCRHLSMEAMRIHNEDGNRRGVAVSLNNIGWSALNQCRLEEAMMSFEESRLIREGLRDERGVAFLEVNNGWALVRGGRHAEARTMIERALKTTTALDDQQLRSWSLAMLGNLYDDLGDYEKALPLLSESIAIMAEVGSLWTVIFEQCSLARVLHHSGEPEKAYSLLTVLRREVEGTRTRWIEGIISYEMGSVCFARGDYDASVSLYRECMELRESISDLLGTAQCLVGCATHARLRGESETAGSFCRLALLICEDHGGHLPEWERSVVMDILSDPETAGGEPISLLQANEWIAQL